MGARRQQRTSQLQWLCATHNLEKSDAIPETYAPDQLWMRFLTELDDKEVTLGTRLVALEIRTANSIYDVVLDDDIVVCWKRGARHVYVEAFDGLDALIPDDGPNGGKHVVIWGDPERERPLFRSSKVQSVTDNIDPLLPLARIGKKPGARLDLTHGAAAQ